MVKYVEESNAQFYAISNNSIYALLYLLQLLDYVVHKLVLGLGTHFILS